MVHNEKWDIDISGKGKNITFTVYGDAVTRTYKEFVGYYGSQPAYMDSCDTTEYDTEVSIEEYFEDRYVDEMDEVQAAHPEIKLWNNFHEENETWANWENLDEESCNKLLDFMLEVNPKLRPYERNDEIIQQAYENDLPEPDYDEDRYYNRYY